MSIRLDAYFIKEYFYYNIMNKIINQKTQIKKDYFFSASIVISTMILVGVLTYGEGLKSNGHQKIQLSELVSELEEKVLPSEGIILPARWDDLGVKMIETGVIDKDKFELLYYANRGGLSEKEKKLLYEKNNGNLIITPENSGFLLNLLWALGLGTKNDILDNGPMTDPRYGGAENFASTGGWTLSKGNSMNHYSRYSFISLTSEQQQLVEKVSKNIYRPCCGNSTHFPDCNHGMAMLGLLELMASQGANEKEIYEAALQVNSYWFPDTYLTIAEYLKNKGIDWKDANPREILGVNFSSASGYAKILSQITEPQQRGGGRCGI